MLRSKQFGTYEIIRKLGRGMTDVYLAFDTQNNRQAVLKIVEESSDSLTQLTMEAERRGAALQKQLHEFDSRVIEIYDCGDLDGYFFVAMQYIEGKNIAEILREEKRLDPIRAARIAIEICSQLDRLHSYTADIDGQRRAVVHGDIKPSNIQIGLNDEVRLLDFGIAKAITFTHHLTHHNFGSPSYCSPERLSKAQVDSHADLWAVAVTLYEMVAGTPPYQAQSTRKLEGLIQSRRPPRALPPDCPPALSAIILKALAGDLHQRYVSFGALRDDLQNFVQNRPINAAKERRTAWNTNETVERPKLDHDTVDKPRAAVVAPLTGLLAKARHWFSTRRVASALSLVSALLWGLLAGLLIFAPAEYFYRMWHQSAPLRTNLDHTRRPVPEINSDWDLYRKLSRQNAWLGRFSPVASYTGPLRASYIAAADDVIERYRNSTDADVNSFDWPKAILCLQHALDIDSRDSAVRGKLALCQGFQSLGQSPNPEPAKQHLLESESLLPRAPEPHLGLARIDVYALKNVGQAVAELHTAQRLGYALGPREMEMEADGYRVRATQEIGDARKAHGVSRDQETRLLQLAQRDFERARRLYEPILGFSKVDVALQQLDSDDRARQQLDDDLRKPPVVVKRKVAWRGRRWQ
jgi:serine/threonine protein kinase